MLKLLAALAAVTGAIAPAFAGSGTFTLATIYEDEYFETVDLTLDNAASIVAGELSHLDCTRLSRLLNAYGGFTACIPPSQPAPPTADDVARTILAYEMTEACQRALDAPTDANLEACTGSPVELGKPR